MLFPSRCSLSISKLCYYNCLCRLAAGWAKTHDIHNTSPCPAVQHLVRLDCWGYQDVSFGFGCCHEACVQRLGAKRSLELEFPASGRSLSWSCRSRTRSFGQNSGSFALFPERLVLEMIERSILQKIDRGPVCPSTLI